MGVKRVKLARLEAIQADEQTARFEDSAFPHPLGTPLGVIGGPDYRRVFHLWVLSRRSAQRMSYSSAHRLKSLWGRRRGRDT
jgi:hypothetical protein